MHALVVPWESPATADVGLPSPDLFLPLVRDDAHYADPSEQFRAAWIDLTLSELRCLLFLYVRADRWSGGMSMDWPLMWDLLATIRGRVEAGQLDSL